MVIVLGGGGGGGGGGENTPKNFRYSYKFISAIHYTLGLRMAFVEFDLQGHSRSLQCVFSFHSSFTLLDMRCGRLVNKTVNKTTYP